MKIVQKLRPCSTTVYKLLRLNFCCDSKRLPCTDKTSENKSELDNCSDNSQSRTVYCKDEAKIKKMKDGKAEQKLTEPKKQNVTLIKGEGVGPELTDALQKVFCVAQVPVEFQVFAEHTAPKCNDVPAELLQSLIKNKFGIKGPINNNRWERQLRQELEINASVTICNKLEGYKSPYGELNCVIIRDESEGEYTGIEHRVVPGVMQTIKVSTTKAATQLAEYVFQYAVEKCHKKITVAHKANIMQLTDGNFLEAMRSVASKYKESIMIEERYLDTVCLNLLMDAASNDVLVSSSMYGDVLSAMASSIVGSRCVCPTISVSDKCKLYGSKNFINMHKAGKDLVNPTGILKAAVIMLQDMQLLQYANMIECALHSIYKEGSCRTEDLGGTAKCSEFTAAICSAIESQQSESY